MQHKKVFQLERIEFFLAIFKWTIKKPTETWIAKVLIKRKSFKATKNHRKKWNHEQLFYDFIMKYLMRNSPITASGGSHTNLPFLIQSETIELRLLFSLLLLTLFSCTFFILSPAFIFFYLKSVFCLHSLFAYKYSTWYIERIVCMSWWEWECKK